MKRNDFWLVFIAISAFFAVAILSFFTFFWFMLFIFPIILVGTLAYMGAVIFGKFTSKKITKKQKQDMLMRIVIVFSVVFIPVAFYSLITYIV